VHVLLLVAAKSILKWNFNKIALFPDRDPLPIETFRTLLSNQFCYVTGQVSSCFFEVTQTVLSAKPLLVVQWVHELLEIGKHIVSVELCFRFLVFDALVQPILQVLLNTGCQASVRLIDQSLHPHEPRVPRFNIVGQNTCFIQVVRGNMEQICASEWVYQRFDLLIFGLDVFLSFKPSDFILYTTRVSTPSPALCSRLSKLVDFLSSLLQLIMDMLGHCQASDLRMELKFFFSLGGLDS